MSNSVRVTKARIEALGDLVDRLWIGLSNVTLPVVHLFFHRVAFVTAEVLAQQSIVCLSTEHGPEKVPKVVG